MNLSTLTYEQLKTLRSRVDAKRESLPKWNDKQLRLEWIRDKLSVEINKNLWRARWTLAN
jgi:hypothetical protein